MNSEAEKLFGAISDWKSNDGWQFADKEAAWKFFFQAGAASRDAEVSDWRSQAHRSQSEADNAIAECAQLRAELAAEQAKNVELLEIAKKGLRHYENRNIAHGTRNPAAIALDEIAAIAKVRKP